MLLFSGANAGDVAGAGGHVLQEVQPPAYLAQSVHSRAGSACPSTLGAEHRNDLLPLGTGAEDQRPEQASREPEGGAQRRSARRAGNQRPQSRPLLDSGRA